MTPINWSFIARAVEYYTQHGFKYIDVPWVVSRESEAATKPVGLTSYPVQDGVLVGSGEQGFIELGRPLGRFVTCTPCFRDESSLSDTVRPYFMKVELYQKPARHVTALQMAGLALNLFSLLGVPNLSLSSTRIGWDVLGGANAVELGSYGVRGDFAYATGLAEPRLSAVLTAGRGES